MEEVELFAPVMTIHQSKGLEFEGVIIPDIQKDQLSISKKDANKPNVVYHKGNVIFRRDIEGEAAEDRKTMITGFIDRLQVFEKEGKLTAVITDYKTNVIRDENTINELRNLYDCQLNLYGNAIKELLYVKGKKVDEVVLQLYFLYAGEIETINFEEETVSSQLKDMDSVFGRNFAHLTVEVLAAAFVK